ncbi:hypothetical protein IWQ62_000841 [Dispira parvispora]|uniref:DH domain-containing protein n=1 Tax=Dispira parvispora TaxID=1520584 RepID=A0A9W8AWA2_9FUNG|nr:hypothetical protein IWQ62_000841 [Dispira parvispora]
MGGIHGAFVATLSLPFTFAVHKPLPAVVKELVPLQKAEPPEHYLTDAKYNGIGKTKIHVYVEDIRTYCTCVHQGNVGDMPKLQEPEVPTFEIIFRLRLLLLRPHSSQLKSVPKMASPRLISMHTLPTTRSPLASDPCLSQSPPEKNTVKEKEKVASPGLRSLDIRNSVKAIRTRSNTSHSSVQSTKSSTLPNKSSLHSLRDSSSPVAELNRQRSSDALSGILTRTPARVVSAKVVNLTELTTTPKVLEHVSPGSKSAGMAEESPVTKNRSTERPSLAGRQNSSPNVIVGPRGSSLRVTSFIGTKISSFAPTPLNKVTKGPLPPAPTPTPPPTSDLVNSSPVEQGSQHSPPLTPLNKKLPTQSSSVKSTPQVSDAPTSRRVSLVRKEGTLRKTWDSKSFLPRLSTVSTLCPDKLFVPVSPATSHSNEDLEALVDEQGNVFLHPGNGVQAIETAEPDIASDNQLASIYRHKSLPPPPPENDPSEDLTSSEPPQIDNDPPESIPEPVSPNDEEDSSELIRRPSRAISEFRKVTIKRSVMQKHIVNEIVTTEKTFMEALKVIQSTWMDPAFDGIAPHSQVMDPLDARTIFKGIDELLEHTTTFYQELQDVMGDMDDYRGGIAQVFLKPHRRWEAFPLFMRNLYHAKDVIRSNMANKGFAKFHAQSMQSRVSKNATLDSLLILPLQRITRYNLLLDKLLKQTPRRHWEHSQLKEAMTMIEKHTVECNEDPGEITLDCPFYPIVRDFRNVPVMIYRPSRTFILDSRAHEMRSDLPVHLLLFDDVLLVAVGPSTRSWPTVTKRNWTCTQLIDLMDLSVLSRTCAEGNKYITILSVAPPSSRGGRHSSAFDFRTSTMSSLPDPEMSFFARQSIKFSTVANRSKTSLMGSPGFLPSPPFDDNTRPVSRHSQRSLISLGECNTPHWSIATTHSNVSALSIAGGVGNKNANSTSDYQSIGFAINNNGEKQSDFNTHEPVFFTLQHPDEASEKVFSQALDKQITKVRLTKYVPPPSTE